MPKPTDYQLAPQLRDALIVALGPKASELSVAEAAVFLLMTAGVSMRSIGDLFENTTRSTAVDIFESLYAKAVAVRSINKNEKRLVKQDDYDPDADDTYDPAEASILATLSAADGIDSDDEYEDTEPIIRLDADGRIKDGGGR